jgi:hypothetical protein
MFGHVWMNRRLKSLKTWFRSLWENVSESLIVSLLVKTLLYNNFTDSLFYYVYDYAGDGCCIDRQHLTHIKSSDPPDQFFFSPSSLCVPKV